MKKVVRVAKWGLVVVTLSALSDCAWGLCHSIPGPSILCGLFV